MRINQNISAAITNAQLHRTEDNLTASIQRLSSGFKINKASDNPSGMAISNKMRAQINALDQADRNANDGTSVLQTADGALNETMEILQRMRELSVQAATDSMTDADKAACQDEIFELQQELDRIASDTEFNSKSLLDGSQDRRVFSNQNVSNFRTSEHVDDGDYSVTVLPGRRARGDFAIDAALTDGNSHSVSLNGYTFSVSGDYNKVLSELREGAQMAGISVDAGAAAGEYNLTTKAFGEQDPIEIIVDGVVKSNPDNVNYAGIDAEVTLGAGFSATATTYSDGNRVIITDADGFELSFNVGDESFDLLTGAADPTLRDYVMDVTSIGTMNIQVGAHESQEISVAIPAVDSESLMVADVNVCIEGGADKAIAKIDEAIAQVSSVRSRIGAYENRIDYTVKSLEATNENMESAISRIQDTDMAEEMTAYSNLNILNQAAISVLSQANDMPQQVLQLLN